MNKYVMLCLVLLIGGCTCQPTTKRVSSVDDATNLVDSEVVDEFEAGVPDTVVMEQEVVPVSSLEVLESSLPVDWTKVSKNEWSLWMPTYEVIQSSNDFEFAAVVKTPEVELLFSVDSDSDPDIDLSLTDFKKSVVESFGTLITVKSENSVNINGLEVAVLDTEVVVNKKVQASALVYLVVKNNVAHLISCGGTTMNEVSRSTCTMILNTLNLK